MLNNKAFNILSNCVYTLLSPPKKLDSTITHYKTKPPPRPSKSKIKPHTLYESYAHPSKHDKSAAQSPGSAMRSPLNPTEKVSSATMLDTLDALEKAYLDEYKLSIK